MSDVCAAKSPNFLDDWADTRCSIEGHLRDLRACLDVFIGSVFVTALAAIFLRCGPVALLQTMHLGASTEFSACLQHSLSPEVVTIDALLRA